MMDDNKENNVKYIIRFLNTQLVGCEYQISDDVTKFIITTPQDIARQQEALLSGGVIFIPDDVINTVYTLTAHHNEAQPQLTFKSDNEDITSHVSFQQITRCNGAVFALKQHPDEPWSEAIEHYRPDPDTDNVATGSVPRPGKTLRLTLAASVMLLTLIAAGLLWTTENQKIINVQQIIGGDKDNYHTFIGKDKKTYVLAHSEKSAGWAYRSLIKRQAAGEATVLDEMREKQRIATVLRTRWPQMRFHLIRLTDPANPEIILSRERNPIKDEKALSAISAELSRLFPWINAVRFSSLSDTVVSKQAESGIRKIAASWRTEKSRDSVTFITTGALQDNELNALKNYVTTFNADWQGQYIEFYIELENDWLKGKSYQYGADGYIKMTPSHWYFPQPLKEL